MNYDFPEINHIDDVIPHIENRPEFRVMVKDWYTVINYTVNLLKFMIGGNLKFFDGIAQFNIHFIRFYTDLIAYTR